MTSRENFLQHIEANLFVASIIGETEKFSVLKPEVQDDILDHSAIKPFVPEISDDLLKKAAFFAHDVMKFIPAEVFSNRSEKLIDKEKEILERNETIKMLPVFDIEKVPQKIIKDSLLCMYADDYVDKLLHDKSEFEKNGKPMIYLASLWANDFMEYDGMDYDAKEVFFWIIEIINWKMAGLICQ